ncbi:MAG: NAD(P)H-hydrate epimerase, partial [Sulfurimonas sp.]
MQKIFYELASLDQRCYNTFELSEDLLMEHAADGMREYITTHYDRTHSLLVVCGSGNNGADGMALARILHQDYRVCVYLPFGASSPMAQLQLRRATNAGVDIVNTLPCADIIVDALFGTGFSRAFDTETAALLQQINTIKAIKIACDIPSGLHREGTLEKQTFRADVTLTMGALKLSMFSDAVKDVVGTIHVLNLGLSRALYETDSNYRLLESDDLKLPHRNIQNTHKGSFGHLAIVCGEKQGAAIIAATAAFRFGAGLVTLLSNENVQLPHELMQSHLLPDTTTAIALGMGLGNEFSDHELESYLQHNLPIILDADIFSHALFLTLLQREQIIITPHPKEFTTVLKACDIADIGVEELQNNRFYYVECFSKAYPHVVLLLKGANVIIAHNETYYINALGTNALAKGGSG